MHLFGVSNRATAALAVSAILASLGELASAQDQQASIDGAAFSSSASVLVSSYIPSSAYAELTASVASAAAAASVTGDPASLFFSAILEPTPPSWFSSAVPSAFSSNVEALESAISGLQPGATLSPSATVVLATTTNSLGSTVTTSFTSTMPTAATSSSSITSTGSDSSSSAGSQNAAAPTTGPQQLAGVGIAALFGLVAVM